MSSVKAFLKKEPVLLISFVLAVISAFIVKPDKTYFGYIDYRTLAILLSLMLIMAGLQKANVFRQIGELFISRVSSFRVMALVLILLCFFFSMFITNDVALITFVPFTVIVLGLAGKKEKLMILVILETVAANLGSMMMPMGNPQNLYLFSLADMPLGQFVLMMLPYGGLSLVMIVALCFAFTSGDRVSMESSGDFSRTGREKAMIFVYLALFVISLLAVSRVVDYRIALILVLAAVLFLDRTVLKKADYSLLLTFVFLFIFIGNLKRIPAVSDALSSVVSGREVFTSVIASQVISNVPAAILLSGFTDNVNALIVGTNLGGLGTLIASMASLISYKLFSAAEEGSGKKYLGLFSVINVGMLLVLLGLSLIIG